MIKDGPDGRAHRGALHASSPLSVGVGWHTLLSRPAGHDTRSVPHTMSQSLGGTVVDYQSQFEAFKLTEDAADQLRQMADPRFGAPARDETFVVETVVVQHGVRTVTTAETSHAKLV